MGWRPTVALTMGDVAGIGPEVIARACSGGSLDEVCRPVVVGHPDVLRRALRLIGRSVDVVEVDHPAALSQAEGGLACWNPAGADAADVPPGRVDPRAGSAAYEYLAAATESALAGEIDAITTAPLNKAALHLAGHVEPGHTEILAKLCRAREFAMMLYLPSPQAATGPRPGASSLAGHGLGVAHVTLHTSIASVPALLTTAAVQEKIGLVHRFMREMGAELPRIGVCALNPHGGEQGLFGKEEQLVIEPAVRAAQDEGIRASGPLPADTLLKRAVAGEFDGVVAMYHDQGHIALKLIGFDRAVNVTLGLPIVRTSPSHGTAYDIAWQHPGRADDAGFREAVRVAARLAERRRTRAAVHGEGPAQ